LVLQETLGLPYAAAAAAPTFLLLVQCLVLQEILGLPYAAAAAAAAAPTFQLLV
jgi:hypothetical protein